MLHSPSEIGISVIIPIYNGARTLPFLLSALAQQDYPQEKRQFILVDNKSTDQTIAVITQYQEQFPNMFELVIEDKMQCSYAARNTGIERAGGRILAFTDADCIPNSNWLSAIAVAMADPEMQYMGGHIQLKAENPNLWETYDSTWGLRQKDYCTTRGFAATANMAIRRELMEKYGAFISGIVSGGDKELGLRLEKHGITTRYHAAMQVAHPPRNHFHLLHAKNIRIAKGFANIYYIIKKRDYHYQEDTLLTKLRWLLRTIRNTQHPFALKCLLTAMQIGFIVERQFLTQIYSRTLTPPEPTPHVLP
jgi:glycosyltransferase involved in cell wall biosynthesis